MKTLRGLFFFSLATLFVPLSTFSHNQKNQDPASVPSGGARAQTHGGVIEGRVLDPDGREVSGAQVTLLDGLTPVAERETGADGHYSFGGLSSGTYTLTANSEGFSALSTDVEV